jgi:rSAM/selenodomain-associated transferase 1
MTAVQVLVLAKEPVAGRVKTRLTPALTPQEAAQIAEAALEDTLDAVRRTDAAVRVLVLDGTWAADGFAVQPQGTGELDERLAQAFDAAWAENPVPMLLIGMDTPQVTEVLLEKAVATLLSPGVDAVLGLAEDGGWWGLGLRRPQPHLIRGVVTSRDDTGQVQRERLLSASLELVDLPVLRDVDTVEDLLIVAASCPEGRFTATVTRVLP